MNIYKRTSVPGRSQSKSSQSRSFEERRKRRIITGTIAGTIALASWLFIFSTISFMPSLALFSVHVYGAEADVTPHLTAAAYRSIEGSYLGIFSKANAFLYPKNAIMAAVSAASARIDSVTVTPDGFHGLNVAVKEKNPAAVACAGLPNFDNSGLLIQDKSDQGDCYFADDSGYIFKKIPLAVPDSYNRYYAPTLPDDPIGHLATSTGTFRALQEFVNGARTSGISPEAVLFKAGGEYELYVRNVGTSTAIIYFNDSASLPTELSNLSAFWNSMNRTARAKGKPLNFEYIDVRYGSNVFYRLIQ